ncbi:hypothetical protein KL943_002472 [Ogataea angusta]|nr:hypothetical protein KL943_002472 [Ogataea angusta]
MSESQRKKRQYSRNGCKECKRRKLKCDEGKPQCWNCAHLHKECVYERTIKFTSSRTFTIESQNTRLINLGETSGAASAPVAARSARGGKPVTPDGEMAPLTFAQPPAMVQNPPLAPAVAEVDRLPSVGPHLQGKPRRAFEQEMRQQLAFEPATPLHQSKELDNNLFTGASHLISDLNDLIQSFRTDFEQPDVGSSYYFYIRQLTNTLETDFDHGEPAVESVVSGSKLSAFPPPSPAVLMSGVPERFDFLASLNNSISSQDLSDLAAYFGWSFESPRLNYLNVLITKIHLNILPFTTNLLHNSFIKCFLLEAKSSPHLLYALLAISARYESYQLKPRDGDEDSREKQESHQKLRSYYLSSCLKSLDAILHSKPKILNNIQSLLLTILILASDYSASTGSQWRAHLRGAKDLLIKYCKYMPISLELGIIWTWFYSMETLAALTSPSGGTIHDFKELTEFLDVMKSSGPVGATLAKFGFYAAGNYHVPAPVHNTFNLYHGYNDDVQELFKEIVLTLEARRLFAKDNKLNEDIGRYLNKDGQVLSSQVLKMMGLVEKARLFKCIATGPPYRIPLDSPNHPLNLSGIHYNNPDGKGVVMCAYMHNTNPLTSDPDDTKNWYSWLDLSQQLYTDACYLKILTMKHCMGRNGLAITNELVQDVVNRMLLGLDPLVRFKDNLRDEDIARLTTYYSELSELTEATASMDFDQYLYYQFDHRLIMVQWPLFVCGLCSVLPQQKCIIECCFKALMDLGVGSGEISLMKLKRLWKLEKEGFDYEKCDIFGGDNDSVPFV